MQQLEHSELLQKVKAIREKMSSFPKLIDGLDIPIGGIDELSIDTKNRKTAVRHYRPLSQGTHAAVFYMHGGAFCLSNYLDDEPMARQLARDANVAVFSIDYGLAPEYPFPSAIEEIYTVIRTITSDAERYGIDPHRIAVAGNSAGANLALAISILSAERKDFTLAALSLIYPVLDLTVDHRDKLVGKAATSTLRPELITTLVNEAYLSNDPSNLENRLVSVKLLPDVRVLPPTLLISAEHCPFTPEHNEFFERLKAGGVECLHKVYPGVDHGFMDMGGEETLQYDCKALVSSQLKSILNRRSI